MCPVWIVRLSWCFHKKKYTKKQRLVITSSILRVLRLYSTVGFFCVPAFLKEALTDVDALSAKKPEGKRNALAGAMPVSTTGDPQTGTVSAQMASCTAVQSIMISLLILILLLSWKVFLQTSVARVSRATQRIKERCGRGNASDEI